MTLFKKFKGKYELVPREEWGAAPAKSSEPLKTPVYMLLLMDTKSKECNSKEECIGVVKELQREYMDDKQFDDVPWNFMIGGDGRIYEGRGWKINPIKTDMNNPKLRLNDKKSLDIAYIGNYEKKYPRPCMMYAVGRWLEKTIKKGYIIEAHDMKLFIKKKSLRNRLIELDSEE